jgi:hypothetical protein
VEEIRPSMGGGQKSFWNIELDFCGGADTEFGAPRVRTLKIRLITESKESKLQWRECVHDVVGCANVLTCAVGTYPYPPLRREVPAFRGGGKPGMDDYLGGAGQRWSFGT